MQVIVPSQIVFFCSHTCGFFSCSSNSGSDWWFSRIKSDNRMDVQTWVQSKSALEVPRHLADHFLGVWLELLCLVFGIGA